MVGKHGTAWTGRQHRVFACVYISLDIGICSMHRRLTLDADADGALAQFCFTGRLGLLSDLNTAQVGSVLKQRRRDVSTPWGYAG